MLLMILVGVVTYDRKYTMKKFLLVCMLLISLPAYAQTVTVDLSQVDSETARRVLAEKKRIDSGLSPQITIDNVEKWSQVGKNVADAVAATAKGLSVEVNEFIKTPVGKATFFLVAWKFFGAKLWSVIGGTIAWIILSSLIWKSFSIFHRPQKVLVKQENKTKFYEYKAYDWHSHDAKTFSAVVHVLIFCLLTITMLIIVL